MMAHGRPIGRVPIMILLLFLSACTTTIYPPRHVADPVRAAVLDHGRHASLVVEVPGRPAMIRYAYGEWDWYALRQIGAAEAISAVFWPTQGALGRKELPGTPSPDTVAREVRDGIENAVYFNVEADAARSLIARLDRTFSENISTRIYNEPYDLEFVQAPESYWLFHNSNFVVGRWLEELRCRIEGPTYLSDWRLGTEPDG